MGGNGNFTIVHAKGPHSRIRTIGIVLVSNELTVYGKEVYYKIQDVRRQLGMGGCTIDRWFQRPIHEELRSSKGIISHY